MDAYCKAAWLAAAICVAQSIAAPRNCHGQTDPMLPAEPPIEQEVVDSTDDVLNMDLEQLANADVVVPSLDITVTTVTKQESTVGQSPAAIYVVTQEMIRRSGATTIADALRLVPGIHVANIDNSTWAVGCRGFGGRFTDNLLVLFDGRMVYMPFFTGVEWDSLHYVLADIERIEVIRGPGATIWGSNAVDGVINIITKRAADTQGLLVQQTGGSELRTESNLRYGGKIGPDVNYRIYGKHFDRDAAFSPEGAVDDWRLAQSGFRSEWTPTDCDLVTLQGDFYEITKGFLDVTPLPGPPYETSEPGDMKLRGGNLLSRWSRIVDDDSDWSVQWYYDRALRNTYVNQAVETYDVEFQYRFRLSDRHRMICGTEYRRANTYVTSDNTFKADFDPANRDLDLVNYFAEDDITLVEERLHFIVGSKFEHEEFTDFEFQPTTRLLYTPDDHRTLWAAVSRAVRLPNIGCTGTLEGFTSAPSAPGLPFRRLVGNDDLVSVDLLAYEIGYREQTTATFAWDVALFYNVYDDRMVLVPGEEFVEDDPAPPHDVLPIMFVNDGREETHGAEIFATWDVREHWRLSGWYAYEYVKALDTVVEGSTPRNQAYLRSAWDLTPTVDLDFILRYVDSLPGTATSPGSNIDSYLMADVRIAWRPRPNLELSVAGLNLTDSHHRESFDLLNVVAQPTEVERSVYGMVSWRR